MDHQTTLSMDWWMHELYRCMKSFIQSPNEDMQNRLVSLLSEYRSLYETRAKGEIHDEHEQLMDYC